MKFRVPEIVLGALLTVAVFAIGMLSESSRRHPAEQQAASNTAKEGTSHQPERSLWNWVTHDAAGFFTLWLVIVGGGQIGLFYWQLRLIKVAADDAKRAGEAAERAAKATEDAVGLSRDTAKRQLRAYVIVDAESFDTRPGKFISKLKVINTGQTPAYEMKVLSKTDILPLPLPEGFDFSIEDPGNPSVSTLGRDRDVGHASELTTKDVARQRFDAALADDAAEVIYTFGTATYRDAFGDPQHTNFCVYFAWEKDRVTCRKRTS
jgi:hypothetical protein